MAVVKSHLSLAILACLVVMGKANPTTTTSAPPPSCPHGCKCTDNGLTVDCSNRGFVHLPPMSERVTKLDLSRNLLDPPTINGFLGHLRQLQEVDLSHNSFQRLELCTFTGLRHLRSVDLHGNRLHSLPISLFADNEHVEVLDLSHNHLPVLPDILLHTLPHLKVLNVSHNEATQLKLGLRFQILTQLTLLDLSHNPFVNVSRDAFETAATWNHSVPRALHLSYCQLQNLDPQALTKVPSLKTLSLTGNPLLPFQQVVSVLGQLENSSLEVIHLSNMSISNPALFSDVSLMALRELDLSGNIIGSVPAATFGNVRSLLKLDLSGNLLTGLDEGFEDLVNLVELNVSHCRLSSFQGSPVGRMEHLTSLDLSHNKLLDPAEVDLSGLRQLRLLDLSYNTLQGIVLPGDCSHLVTLTFTSNALTSLPSMANMRSLKHFSASDNNLQSLSAFLFTEATDILVANFRNNDLTTIDHRAFLPTSPQVIDLSHNFLTRTQFYSWTTTREVYLHNNKLNELDQHTFYGMDRLEVLDLGHNNVSMIDDETFKFLGNVTSLRLSNNSLRMSNFFRLFRNMESLTDLHLGFNHIQTINTTSFHPLVSLTSLSLTKNNLKVIPVELFNNLEKLAEVDISGNPFDCDCELLPLQEWLRKTKVKVRQRFDLNITNRCVTPARHRGKLVTLFEVGQFQCSTKLLYMIIFGSIGGLIIIVGIIASLVCHYYRKWRKKRSDEIPVHPEHKTVKADNSSQGKDTNRNKVDLVRVSKRPDPYSKEDLINGWVASKQFTVAKQNVDPQYYRRQQQQQGPPRPPLPDKVSSSRNKKEEKGKREMKGKREEKEKGKGRVHKPKQENPDRRIRTVSEMVPFRAPQERHARGQPMAAVWDEVYYDKQQVNLRPRADRWTDADAYRTWHHQPQVMRPVYHRDAGRYYTLPYPAPGPRHTPYGPDYPYRVRMTQEEEERFQARQQTRALPYPPRQQDLRVHTLRPSPADYRNNQRNYSYDPYATERARDPYPAERARDPYATERARDPYATERARDPYATERARDPYATERARDPYAAERARDYENLRDSRDESWRLAQEERENRERAYQERAFQENHPDIRRDRQEYETDRQPDSRSAGNNNGRRNEDRGGNTAQENGGKENPQGQGDANQNTDVKRGTSEAQVHRRDSDYRSAMENPLDPKANSAPPPTEDKASDWL